MCCWTAGQSDIDRSGRVERCPSSRRSTHLEPSNPPFPSKPSTTEEFVNLLRGSHRVSQLSGWLLGVSLFSYRVREFLICWLFFTLLFVGLALVILAVGLVCYAGKYAFHWATMTTRVAPIVALGPGDLCPRAISDSIKLR